MHHTHINYITASNFDNLMKDSKYIYRNIASFLLFHPLITNAGIYLQVSKSLSYYKKKNLATVDLPRKKNLGVELTSA